MAIGAEIGSAGTLEGEIGRDVYDGREEEAP
jgi:hypothetical protein